MYTELNEKIERFSKWAHFFMIDVFVYGFTIGSLCQCYANYYVFDLKEDSFHLPIPLV